MRISRIFPLLVAALAGTPVGAKLYTLKKEKRYEVESLYGSIQKPNGGSFSNTQKGWRKVQSRAAHLEIQRRQRRNA